MVCLVVPGRPRDQSITLDDVIPAQCYSGSVLFRLGVIPAQCLDHFALVKSLFHSDFSDTEFPRSWFTHPKSIANPPTAGWTRSPFSGSGKPPDWRCSQRTQQRQENGSCGLHRLFFYTSAIVPLAPALLTFYREKYRLVKILGGFRDLAHLTRRLPSKFAPARPQLLENRPAGPPSVQIAGLRLRPMGG